jgi:hypothetical protein
MRIEDLLGMTMVSVEKTSNDDELIFTADNGRKFKLYHAQDCCESVYIEDIIGDLNDLIGSPLTLVEEISQEGNDDSGSYTWTFYKFATIKGYVDVRWQGYSNGYYSESVDFMEIK